MLAFLDVTVRLWDLMSRKRTCLRAVLCAGFMLAATGASAQTTEETAAVLRACDGGSASACLAAARNVQFGVGVTRDLAFAQKLTSRACDLGLALACVEAGRRYEFGWDSNGTDRDLARARDSYDRGCKAGDLAACAKVEELTCEAAGGAPLQQVPVLQDMFARSGSLNACAGGMVLRMAFDVTGDDRPELFLASSQVAANSGIDWTIYSPTSRERCGYLGTLFLPYGGFRFDAERHELVRFQALNNAAGVFAYVPVGAAGFGDTRVGDLVQTDAPEFIREWTLISEWWAEGGRDPAGADLGGLLRDPETIVWMNMRTRDPVTPQALTRWSCN
jgi:TPR repeat protein